MLDNQEIKVYRFGFEFNDIIFVWHEKKLFRMPYESSKKCYSKRQLKQQKVGNSIGYWVSGVFKSMSNLKEITTEVNYKETNIVIDKDALPF